MGMVRDMHLFEKKTAMLHNRRTKQSYYIFYLLPYFFIVDQLLLPTFHYNLIPFKGSYFILIGWFFLFLYRQLVLNKRSISDSDFISLGFLFLLLISITFLGQIWVFFYYNIIGWKEFSQCSLFAFLFSLFAFGYGTHIKSFNFRFLIYVAYVYIILTLIMILFFNAFHFLVYLYYGGIGNASLNNSYYALSLTRSIGLFGNPDVSMSMLNTIFLFIILAYKNIILIIKKIELISLVFFIFFMAVLFQSRDELIASTLYLIFLIYFILRQNKQSFYLKTIKICLCVFSLLLLLFVLIYFLNLLHGGAYLTSFIKRWTQVHINYTVGAYSIFGRPFLEFFDVWNRFIKSPLVGTGYGVSNVFPFQFDSSWGHNDFFRILSSAGVLGLLVWLIILWRCYTVGGLIVLIPFFTSGLTNTFIGNIPVMLFYFFMIGIFNRYKRMQYQANLIAKLNI